MRYLKRMNNHSPIRKRALLKFMNKKTIKISQMIMVKIQSPKFLNLLSNILHLGCIWGNKGLLLITWILQAFKTKMSQCLWRLTIQNCKRVKSSHRNPNWGVHYSTFQKKAGKFKHLLRARTLEIALINQMLSIPETIPLNLSDLKSLNFQSTIHKTPTKR